MLSSFLDCVTARGVSAAWCSLCRGLYFCVPLACPPVILGRLGDAHHVRESGARRRREMLPYLLRRLHLFLLDGPRELLGAEISGRLRNRRQRLVHRHFRVLHGV